MFRDLISLFVIRRLPVLCIFLLCNLPIVSGQSHLIDSARNLAHHAKYESALKLAKSLVNEADSSQKLVLYNVIGKCYYYQFSYDSGEYYYNLSISLNQHSNTKEEVLTWIGLGKLSYRTNIPERMNDIIGNLGRLLPLLPGSEFEPYYHLFRAYANSVTNMSLAEREFRKAIQLFSPLDPDIIEAYVSFIDFYLEAGNVEDARGILEESLLVADNFKIYEGRYWDLQLEKGYYYFVAGFYIESISVYEEEIIPSIKNNKSLASRYTMAECLRMSAWSYESVGNIAKAVENNNLYLKMIKHFHDDNYWRIGEVCSTQERLLRKMGFRELAREFEQRHLSISKRKRNDLEHHIYLYNAGFSSYMNEEFTKASIFFDSVINYPYKTHITYYYIALAHKYKSKICFINKKIDSAIFEAREFGNWGDLAFPENKDVHTDANNLLLPLLSFRNSKSDRLEIAHLIRNELDFYHLDLGDRGMIQFYNHYSRQLIRNGFLDSALLVINKVLSFKGNALNSKALKDNRVKIENLTTTISLKADCYLKKFQHKENTSYLDSAVNALHKAVSFNLFYLNSYSSPKDRIEYTQRLRGLFDVAVSISYELCRLRRETKNLNHFFTTTELSKSGELFNSLTREAAISSFQIPDTLSIQISSLKHQNSFLTTEIIRLEDIEKLEKNDSIRLQDFKLTLIENKVDFQETMRYLEEHFPTYYEVNYNPSIASLQIVQQNLESHEAFIEYFEGDDYLYAITIAQDTAFVTQMELLSPGTIETFQKNLQPAHFQNEADDAYHEFIEGAYDIYREILEKPLTGLSNREIDKLYIIPDKSLNYLPFDLLLTEDRSNSNILDYSQLPFLIQDYTISYAYSASILFRERLIKDLGKRKQKRGSGKLLSMAPSYGALLRDSSHLAELGKFRNDFSELLYNKAEVDAISQYFEGSKFKNEHATKAAFLEDVKNYDILHLAMHALVDTENPEHSRLVFAPQEDDSYDHYLHNFELYNMNINLQLAVLSACNTGDGKLLGGEGVMSVARAFTYAGAKSVVMSQWQVDDQASSIIMKFFYKYLSKGKNKDESLRLAKLEFLKSASNLKQHPFFWSNFVLMGDTSPVVRKTNWSPKYFWIMLVLVGGFLGLMFLRKQASSINFLN